jgi:hypothetical protein
MRRARSPALTHHARDDIGRVRVLPLLISHLGVQVVQEQLELVCEQLRRRPREQPPDGAAAPDERSLGAELGQPRAHVARRVESGRHDALLETKRHPARFRCCLEHATQRACAHVNHAHDTSNLE